MKKLQLAPLTEKQKEVFIYVTQYIRKHGFAPRYIDIANETSANTAGAIAGTLNGLANKGYLNYEKNKHRGLFLSATTEKLNNRQIKNITVIQ